MRILFLSAFFPCPEADSAGVLDAYHILRELSQENEIVLVSFASAGDEAHVPAVERLCARVILVDIPASPGSTQYLSYTGLSFLSRLPAIARMSHSSEMVRVLRREVATEDFDLAVVEFTQMAHYVEYLKGIPAILDESDIAFVRRERFAATVRNPITRFLLQWDTRKLREYEISNAGRYRAILVRTETDMKLLQEHLPESRIEVFPPWIDLSFASSVNGGAEGASMLFYGAMWRPANEQGALYFAREIFPLIQERIPESEFMVVGSRPSRRLTTAKVPGMAVTGFVPSVEPYYRKAAVVVAPLLAGSGIKGKVVQAMACGKPVVTTSVGAEGIPATERDGLFVRDDAREFAECVEWLVREKHFLQFREPARQFVARSYDWPGGVSRLKKLSLELCARGHSAEALVE